MLGRTVDALCLFDDKGSINGLYIDSFRSVNGQALVLLLTLSWLMETQKRKDIKKGLGEQKTEVRVSGGSEMRYILLVKVFFNVVRKRSGIGVPVVHKRTTRWQHHHKSHNMHTNSLNEE